MLLSTPLLALIGPTAVGKTALSLLLAETLGAEVVSVDSRQVYRSLDVGADKISSEIRRRIPHHLIDVADPDQPFSAADFVIQATDAVDRIRRRGRVPLLVGGTPFYYAALAEGSLTPDLPRNWELRARLEAEAAREGKEVLYWRLAERDAEYAGRIHPHDLRRVVRGLEIMELSGKTPSQIYREGGRGEKPFTLSYVGLTRPREELYQTISRRATAQFASGFPEEVRMLLDRGYDPRCPALQGFGYRELVRYHQGLCSLEDALEGDIAATKAFSRRQMTWFRKFTPVLWYDLSAESEERILKQTVDFSRQLLEDGATCTS